MKACIDPYSSAEKLRDTMFPVSTTFRGLVVIVNAVIVFVFGMCFYAYKIPLGRSLVLVLPPLFSLLSYVAEKIAYYFEGRVPKSPVRTHVFIGVRSHTRPGEYEPYVIYYNPQSKEYKIAKAALLWSFRFFALSLLVFVLLSLRWG